MASPTLHIHLLGGFRLVEGDEPIQAVKGDRQRSFLAYLLLHRHAPQSRQHLAFSLWPDSDEPQARANLRNLLHTLRQALPDPDRFIAGDTQSLQWRPDGPFTLDVASFLQMVERASTEKDAGERRRWLEAAVSLYTGDLLPGIYDDWLLLAREDLRQTYLRSLDELVHLLERAGDLRSALQQLQQRLLQDPLHEPTYVQMMRLQALSGNRAGVQRVLQQCAAVLARELDVEPSPATRDAYAEYLRLPAAPEQVEVAPVAETPRPRPTPGRPRPLPAPATPLLGRQEEMADLARRLADPHCRLLTLVGAGGVGKTRLALETARGHLPVYADGVAFVSLAGVEAVELLVPTVAAALNFTPSGPGEPGDHLLAHLADREMLLVLDNFEQLLEGFDLLAAILAAAPGVKLLITSRERLHLSEEWIYELQGLSLEDESERGESAAATLFLHSARRRHIDFEPDPAERAAVERICRLVGGIPLALEMAASWLPVLSCREIAREIEQGLDVLTTTLRNVPEHHRSMRAVFDRSWRLLTPEEQQVARRLAVFRGGFDRPAAEHVAAATLPILASLADKSILHRDTGRYHLHGLIRQYLYEQMELAAETELSRERHLDYFVAWSERTTAPGAAGADGLARLGLEEPNLQAALQWSMAGGQAERGLGLALRLGPLWKEKGAWREGYNWLSILLQQTESLPATPTRAGAFVQAGRLAFSLADPAGARVCFAAALSLASEMEATPIAVQALIGLGDLELDHEAAQALYARSLALARSVDHEPGIAQATVRLGNLASGAGQHEQARELYHEALAIYRALGDSRVIPDILRNLGIIAFSQGQYQQAESIYAECLDLYREMDIRAGIVAALNDLGDTALVDGDYARATHRYVESLERAWALGSQWDVAWGFVGLARTAAQTDRPARAVRLLAAADALFASMAARLRPVDSRDIEQMLEGLRSRMDEPTFASAWAAGHNLGAESALAYALAETEQPG